MTPRDARQALRDVRLYALLTEARCRRPWLETARMLLDGGADALQLREKTLADAELLRRARALRELTAERGALLIVNDRPDVALMAGADGVHLGQDDLPARDVKRFAGPELIIGVSTHSLAQAVEAESLGADYVGVGPVFATETKGYAEGQGVALVEAVCAAVHIPTVAIGGITADNALRVVRAGVTAVAACAALCGAGDPEAAARAMRAVFAGARGLR